MDKLLISTIKKLIVYDLESKSYTTVASGNYYGISWNDKNIFVSRNLKNEPISVIDVFAKDFKKIETLKMSKLGGVHQIYNKNNLLYIANTNYDRIDVWDIKSGKTQIINWTGKTEDTRHINSIWADDKQFYFIESGKTPGKTDKSIHFVPTVQIFDLNHLFIKSIELPLTYQLHNIYIEDNTLFSCGRYMMIRKNLEDNQSHRAINIRQKEGFLRGLGKTKNWFFIGESQELPRREREKSLASILTLDNNLEVVSTVDLNNTGQIHDIRVISGDLAHNGIDL